MMIRDNPTPWVVFALIAMVICGILGMMLGLNPFGPSQEVRNQGAQTQMAVEIRGTENAISAMETPQAIYVQQTAVVAQLTAIPAQQVATQVAGSAEIANAQVYATQTAISGEARNRQLADQATQTAIIGKQQMEALSVVASATALAQGQVRERATGMTTSVVIGFGTITLFVWITLRIIVQAIHARTEEHNARAQFLAEQRRRIAWEAPTQGHNGRKPLRQVSDSVMNSTSSIVDKLPKAE